PTPLQQLQLAVERPESDLEPLQDRLAFAWLLGQEPDEPMEPSGTAQGDLGESSMVQDATHRLDSILRALAVAPRVDRPPRSTRPATWDLIRKGLGCASSDEDVEMMPA